MNPTSLFLGILFGSVGLGFFVYGKKQQAMMPLFCGIGLMILPYLITNIYLLIGISIVLVAVPFLIKK